MWKTVVDTASWLARTIGAPAAGGAVSVIVAVLAINVLLRTHAIEAVLADGHPVWAQMIEPVAWASLLGTMWIIGLGGLAPRTRDLLADVPVASYGRGGRRLS